MTPPAEAPGPRYAATCLLASICALAGCGPVTIGRSELIDETGDGLYDYLEVPVKLRIEEAGHYLLNADLRFNRGPGTGVRRARMTHSIDLTLQPGIESRFLRFAAPEFRQYDYDGPYRIYAVLMRDTEELAAAKATARAEAPAGGEEPAAPLGGEPGSAVDAPRRRPPFTVIGRHSGFTRRIPLEQCATWKDQPRSAPE